MHTPPRSCHRPAALAIAAGLLSADLSTARAGQAIDCIITRQPANARVCPGSSVQMHVEFTGQPTSVEWYRNSGLVATENAPAGGSATLTDTPALTAPDGSPQDATYYARLICPGSQPQSETAVVSPASAQWGPFTCALGGRATIITAAGAGGGRHVKLADSSDVVLDVAGARTAECIFTDETVAALSNTDANGDLTISAQHSRYAPHKGWDGTIKGRFAQEARISKRPGRTVYGNITFRSTAGPGGGPHVLVVHSGVVVLNKPCDTECTVLADVMCRSVSCSAKLDCTAAFCVENADTLVTFDAATSLTVLGTTVLGDEVVFCVPSGPLAEGEGPGVFDQLSCTHTPGSIALPPGDIPALQGLSCTFPEVKIDSVVHSVAPYCPPPCGPPPPDNAATSILSLNERSQPCLIPPLVGTWADPGLMVSPVSGLATDTPYGVTLAGAAMECEDLTLRLTPPPPGTAGACFRLESWSWGTSSGATALSVFPEATTLEIAPDSGGGGLGLRPGPVSPVAEWLLELQSFGSVLRSVAFVPNGGSVCTSPAWPIGAGKVAVQDISFMRFPPGTPITFSSGGMIETVPCDTVLIHRTVPGRTLFAHSALRLEACCLPPFEIIREDIAQRAVQWDDTIVTTPTTSPGVMLSTGSRGWDLKKNQKVFPPAPTDPLGLDDPAVSLAYHAINTKGTGTAGRVIAPPPGDPSRGPRAAVVDFADCAGFMLDFSLDAEAGALVPPPGSPRTCIIKCWGRAPGDTASSARATFALADVPPEPDGGMSLTPAIAGATTYQLTVKNGGVTVFDQSGMSGEAVQGLPRALRCKPCPPPDPDHPENFSLACSFSWGHSQGIFISGNGSAAVVADELVITAEAGGGPQVRVAAFTSCSVQCTNVHDAELEDFHTLRRDVKRGPRTLMTAFGTAFLAGGEDEDCDSVVRNVCDGWLLAGSQFRESPTLQSVPRVRESPSRASQGVLMNNIGSSGNDGVQLDLGEAAQCSFSFGASNPTSVGSGGLSSGRLAAAFERPNGAQEWGLLLSRQIPGGCVLRPDLPVPVSSYRCTVWDSGDSNGGCTPVGPDIIVPGALEISASDFPSGCGFKCDLARTAEPDIVIVWFPFPLSMQIGGQSVFGSAVQIAPHTIAPQAPGPISHLEVTLTTSTGRESPTLQHIVVVPIPPRHIRLNTTSTGKPALGFQWTSPSAIPITTSDLGTWTAPPDTAIEALPNGSYRYLQSYPPPDRLFMQLLDLGWEWPPVPVQ